MMSLEKYLELFFSFFKIGAVTIGGGYAMIPIVQDEIVNKKKWIREEEFIDILSIAQSCPGPIAVNTSVFVGYQTAGIIGAIASTLGCILPSFCIISIVAIFFVEVQNNVYVTAAMKGIRPAVVALIFYSSVNIYKSSRLKRFTIPVILLVAFLVCVLKITPVLILLFVIMIALLYCKRERRG